MFHWRLFLPRGIREPGSYSFKWNEDPARGHLVTLYQRRGKQVQIALLELGRCARRLLADLKLKTHNVCELLGAPTLFKEFDISRLTDNFTGISVFEQQDNQTYISALASRLTGDITPEVRGLLDEIRNFILALLVATTAIPPRNSQWKDIRLSSTDPDTPRGIYIQLIRGERHVLLGFPRNKVDPNVVQKCLWKVVEFLEDVLLFWLGVLRPLETHAYAEDSAYHNRQAHFIFVDPQCSSLDVNRAIEGHLKNLTGDLKPTCALFRNLGQAVFNRFADDLPHKTPMRNTLASAFKSSHGRVNRMTPEGLEDLREASHLYQALVFNTSHRGLRKEYLPFLMLSDDSSDLALPEMNVLVQARLHLLRYYDFGGARSGEERGKIKNTVEDLMSPSWPFLLDNQVCCYVNLAFAMLTM